MGPIAIYLHVIKQNKLCKNVQLIVTNFKTLNLNQFSFGINNRKSIVWLKPISCISRYRTVHLEEKTFYDRHWHAASYQFYLNYFVFHGSEKQLKLESDYLPVGPEGI